MVFQKIQSGFRIFRNSCWTLFEAVVSGVASCCGALASLGWHCLVFVIAGYSYMARQIRRDAAALQSELASVTGEQIRTFRSTQDRAVFG